MSTTSPQVKIYTDGSCSPNPGVGGWAAILKMPARDYQKEISGSENNTTNNRMELLAAMKALQALKMPCIVNLYTDSSYLRNAFEKKWLQQWQRNGWKTRKQQKVLNQDLWQELLRLDGIHQIHWHWIRGHSGQPENEHCDRLAVAARQKLQNP